MPPDTSGNIISNMSTGPSAPQRTLKVPLRITTPIQVANVRVVSANKSPLPPVPDSPPLTSNPSASAHSTAPSSSAVLTSPLSTSNTAVPTRSTSASPTVANHCADRINPAALHLSASGTNTSTCAPVPVSRDSPTHAQPPVARVIDATPPLLSDTNPSVSSPESHMPAPTALVADVSTASISASPTSMSPTAAEQRQHTPSPPPAAGSAATGVSDGSAEATTSPVSPNSAHTTTTATVTAPIATAVTTAAPAAPVSAHAVSASGELPLPSRGTGARSTSAATSSGKPVPRSPATPPAATTTAVASASGVGGSAGAGVGGTARRASLPHLSTTYANNGNSSTNNSSNNNTSNGITGSSAATSVSSLASPPRAVSTAPTAAPASAPAPGSHGQRGAALSFPPQQLHARVGSGSRCSNPSPRITSPVNASGNTGFPGSANSRGARHSSQSGFSDEDVSALVRQLRYVMSGGEEAGNLNSGNTSNSGCSSNLGRDGPAEGALGGLAAILAPSLTEDPATKAHNEAGYYERLQEERQLRVSLQQQVLQLRQVLLHCDDRRERAQREREHAEAQMRSMQAYMAAERERMTAEAREEVARAREALLREMAEKQREDDERRARMQSMGAAEMLRDCEARVSREWEARMRATVAKLQDDHRADVEGLRAMLRDHELALARALACQAELAAEAAAASARADRLWSAALRGVEVRLEARRWKRLVLLGVCRWLRDGQVMGRRVLALHAAWERVVARQLGAGAAGAEERREAATALGLLSDEEGEDEASVDARENLAANGRTAQSPTTVSVIISPSAVSAACAGVDTGTLTTVPTTVATPSPHNHAPAPSVHAHPALACEQVPAIRIAATHTATSTNATTSTCTATPASDAAAATALSVTTESSTTNTSVASPAAAFPVAASDAAPVIATAGSTAAADMGARDLCESAVDVEAASPHPTFIATTASASEDGGAVEAGAAVSRPGSASVPAPISSIIAATAKPEVADEATATVETTVEATVVAEYTGVSLTAACESGVSASTLSPAGAESAAVVVAPAECAGPHGAAGGAADAAAGTVSSIVSDASVVVTPTSGAAPPHTASASPAANAAIALSPTRTPAQAPSPPAAPAPVPLVPPPMPLLTPAPAPTPSLPLSRVSHADLCQSEADEWRRRARQLVAPAERFHSEALQWSKRGMPLPASVRALCGYQRVLVRSEALWTHLMGLPAMVEEELANRQRIIDAMGTSWRHVLSDVQTRVRTRTDQQEAQLAREREAARRVREAEADRDLWRDRWRAERDKMKRMHGQQGGAAWGAARGDGDRDSHSTATHNGGGGAVSGESAPRRSLVPRVAMYKPAAAREREREREREKERERERSGASAAQLLPPLLMGRSYIKASPYVSHTPSAHAATATLPRADPARTTAVVAVTAKPTDLRSNSRASGSSSGNSAAQLRLPSDRRSRSRAAGSSDRDNHLPTATSSPPRRGARPSRTAAQQMLAQSAGRSNACPVTTPGAAAAQPTGATVNSDVDDRGAAQTACASKGVSGAGASAGNAGGMAAFLAGLQPSPVNTPRGHNTAEEDEETNSKQAHTGSSSPVLPSAHVQKHAESASSASQAPASRHLHSATPPQPSQAPHQQPLTQALSHPQSQPQRVVLSLSSLTDSVPLRASFRKSSASVLTAPRVEAAVEARKDTREPSRTAGGAAKVNGAAATTQGPDGGVCDDTSSTAKVTSSDAINQATATPSSTSAPTPPESGGAAAAPTPPAMTGFATATASIANAGVGVETVAEQPVFVTETVAADGLCRDARKDHLLDSHTAHQRTTNADCVAITATSASLATLPATPHVNSTATSATAGTAPITSEPLSSALVSSLAGGSTSDSPIKTGSDAGSGEAQMLGRSYTSRGGVPAYGVSA